MEIEEFRKAGHQAIDDICDYFHSLQDRPVVAQVVPGYLRSALPSSAPEHGEDIDVVTKDYKNLILPGLTLWQHPSFFAYFPSAFSFPTLLADLYARSTCNPSLTWSTSPACIELEAVMMDWAAKLLGLSPAFLNTSRTGGGIIMTTASESGLTAIVAARSLYTRQHPEVPVHDLVVYVTSQTHSLGAKAASILGLSLRTLEVSAEDNFSLRGRTLRDALEEDEARGKRPFVLIATIGTTASGAVDNLWEIGQVVQGHPSLWVHVDAAWAGAALSCPEYRELCQLEAINLYTHSFCANFHKWGLINFDASTLWVRNRKHLTEVLGVSPPFLEGKGDDDSTVIDYRNWHLGFGRRFRSLKFWFVFRNYGVEGFRKHIRQTIRLNELFVSLIQSSPYFSLVTPPMLALTVFRLQPPLDAPLKDRLSNSALNGLCRAFYYHISKRHDILLTHANMNGAFCVRFAVGAEMTTEEHVKKAFDVICEERDVAVKEWIQQCV